MSVYTPVNQEELRRFLATYPVGELLSFEGISAGIENTNYFVDTDDGHWVLTLFERQNEAELPFFLGLMDHLARRGIPSASPAEDRQGNMLSSLNGKPAALVHKLDGRNIITPTAAHCRMLGETLAEMHLAAGSFPGQREGNHGPAWCQQRADAVSGKLSAEASDLLREEVQSQAALPRRDLPQGIVHADLFRDNVLFDGERLSGVIDFYYASSDALLYDLAVVVNDWCFPDQGLNEESYNALLESYARLRPFTDAERACWNAMQRCAALRFWLSRLYDLHYPREGELTHTKDPREFENRLLWLRQHNHLTLP